MTEAVDWKQLIGRLILLKGTIDELDADSIYEYSIPRVAATKPDIDRAEAAIDTLLPRGYREFLLRADGWPYAYTDTHLFGTADFLTEGALYDAAVEVVEVIDEAGGFVVEGLEVEDLVPIGGGVGSSTLFVLVRDDAAQRGGSALWISSGEIVYQGQDFASLLTEIAAAHERIIDDLLERDGQS